MTHVAQPARLALKTPVVLAVLSLLAGTAHAQAADPAAPKAPEAETSVNALSQVVITATKRSTPLQRTPVAVTAINSAQLDDNHVQTIADMVNLVPSFQATTQGDHGVITMTLRGIGNDSAKTEYADPEVAMFVNGIYAPRAEGAAALMFDLESVEVLRGPQGTLWGRNSTVGAVNMQTAKPVLGKLMGSVEGGLGNYGRIGVRGAMNLPLSDDMALRVALVHEQHDGFVAYQRAPQLSLASQQAAAAPVIDAWNTAHPANPIAFQPLNPNIFVQGGPRYSAQDQTAGRLSLLWKPSEALSIDLSYEKFLDRGTPSMNLMQTPREGESFWSALIDTAPAMHRDSNTFRSRIDYALSPDLALAYIGGWSRFTGSADYDQDGGAKVPTSFTTGATYQQNRTNWSRYTNHSHELELLSTGKHEIDWILGLYYAAEDNGIRFDIPIMNGTQQGTVGWQGSFIQPKETVNSQAVFGQATWNLSDALHLTGGARYTHDDRKNIGGTNNGWTGDATVQQVPLDAGSDPLAAGSGFSSYQKNDGHYKGDKATYLGRLSYQVDKDTLFYGSVSTGYKSGGLQDGGRPYGMETLTNYEVGSKMTLAGGSVRFNNAIYYENFKDFQFSAPVTNPDGSHSLATSNAEGAKVYGVESELAAKLTEADRLQLSLAYAHTRLGKLLAGSNDYALPACPDPLISNCLDVTGHELPHAPRFSAQVQYQHTFGFDNGGTLTPRIALHYETASWLSVFNLGDGDKQKAYTRTDVGLRYSAAKGWWTDLWVRNIENAKVKTNAQNAFGAWQSQYLPPLTLGVNAGIEF
ncbi:TonB-dependent receptor [Ideonella azotifigens]|uniref:TonB-dependent receptor n=1 Tax=Ideonella azotifigens TaxID=513160 RepID=A0ABN1KJU2_9BURK|nr:TonB-dependent receptor [Ideonella azotifigens]MCD2339342.1 TonB-dependent receptor [Ideonella azotifigens]